MIIIKEKYGYIAIIASKMKKSNSATKLLEIACKQMEYLDKDVLPIGMKKIFEIPFERYTDDEAVLSLVKEYELYKPDKMADFLIKSFFEAFDSISTQIQSIKGLQISKELGVLKGIKRLIQSAQDNPKLKLEDYKMARGKLDDVIGTLESYTEQMIEEIRSIDNQPRLVFLAKAMLNEKVIDTNMRGIRLCIEAIENAVKTQLFIEKELEIDVGSIMRAYLEFYNEVLLKGDTCVLLDNYEFKNLRNQRYFLRLSDKVHNIEYINNDHNQYIEEYVDVLEGYEDIVFER